MNDDVWDARDRAGAEDFGMPELGATPAVEVVTVQNLVNWGIAVVSEAPAPLLLGGFALWAIGFGAQVLSQFASLGGPALGAIAQDPILQQLLGPLAQLVVGLIAAPLGWVAMAGVLSAAARAVAFGETAPSNAIPSPSSLLAFVVALLAQVLIQLPFVVFLSAVAIGASFLGTEFEDRMLYGAMGLGVGMVLVFLPLFYIGLRLRFAVAAAIVEGNAIEGIKGSWAMTASPIALLHVFLFVLVEFGIGVVNVLLCCTLGVLTVVTVPFFQGALVAAYLRYSRGDDVLDGAGFFLRN